MTDAALAALRRAGDPPGRRVFAFGHSAATVELARRLADAGTPLTAILDNNAAKQGLRAAGVPVVAPEVVVTAGEGSLVIVASRFGAAMRAQLAELGYRGEVVDIGDHGPEFSLSDSTFNEHVTRAERGGELLGTLRARAGGRHLVLCPYNALGDVYWAMAYLPAWQAARGIEATAVVVTGAGCRDVASLFGVDPLATLTQPEMDELMAATVLTRAAAVTVAHHDLPYTNTSIRLLDKAFLPFAEQYRVAVYGLDPTASPAAPTSTDAFAAAAEVPSGRSVILAPHAKSVVGPPAGFWERLAADHAARGRAVFTNIAGDQEPVAGTRALRVPIRQAIAAVEHAGAFVGLRSGLCDVLLTARAEKTVVFPDALYSSTSRSVAEFFALPGFDPLVVPV